MYWEIVLRSPLDNIKMIKRLLSSLFFGPWFYYYFYQSASSPFLLTISQSLHSGEWGPPFITYFLHNHHHIIIFFSIFLLFLSLDDILLPRLICSYEAREKSIECWPLGTNGENYLCCEYLYFYLYFCLCLVSFVFVFETIFSYEAWEESAEWFGLQGPAAKTVGFSSHENIEMAHDDCDDDCDGDDMIMMMTLMMIMTMRPGSAWTGLSTQTTLFSSQLENLTRWSAWTQSS